MIGVLQCVVLDCPDDVELARFYRAVAGGEIDRPDRRWSLGGGWSTLHLDGGVVLCFQRVEGYQAPAWPDPARPQQFHLDFGVPDLGEAEEKVLAAGAELLEATEGRSWRVYADPAGHPFCLVLEPLPDRETS